MKTGVMRILGNAAFLEILCWTGTIPQTAILYQTTDASLPICEKMADREKRKRPHSLAISRRFPEYQTK